MLLAGADLPERAPAHAAGDRFDYGRACLALAGYAEARGEGDAGMATVMAVVLERTTDPRWPDTVCDVVEQPGQFEALARWQPPRHPERDEPEAWTRAQRLAEQLLADDRTLVPAACAGATSFQRGPAASGLVPACIVGRHSSANPIAVRRASVLDRSTSPQPCLHLKRSPQRARHCVPLDSPSAGKTPAPPRVRSRRQLFRRQSQGSKS